MNQLNTYLISYDIGTTGVKTCLFEVEKDIKLLGCEQKGYSLFCFGEWGEWNKMRMNGGRQCVTPHKNF